MERKRFIKYGALGSMAALTSGTILGNGIELLSKKRIRPRAITMWDFSWLERRWPGGSYEDWDQALDELVDRGYDAIRMDVYPHLLAEAPEKEWTILPFWDQQDWGSPGIIKISVMPALAEFMRKCKKRNIKLGLSTWFREDPDNVRMKITSPQKLAEVWLKTLDLLAAEELLDTILYVDLCNEWLSVWTPFFKDRGHDWTQEFSMQWLNESIKPLKEKYPQIPFTVSFFYTAKDMGEKLISTPLPQFDLLEYHMWMASLNDGEFNKTVGYNWHRFSSESYKNLIEKAEPLYRSKPAYWQKMLVERINELADASRKTNMPLVTTECWAIVDYKDFPMLNWDWVKDVCEIGVKTAAATGQWVSIATSNFCGPQFTGMWKDIEWHRRMTKLIKNSVISDELIKTRNIINRL